MGRCVRVGKARCVAISNAVGYSSRHSSGAQQQTQRCGLAADAAAGHSLSSRRSGGAQQQTQRWGTAADAAAGHRRTQRHSGGVQQQTQRWGAGVRTAARCRGAARPTAARPAEGGSQLVRHSTSHVGGFAWRHNPGLELYHFHFARPHESVAALDPRLQVLLRLSTTDARAFTSQPHRSPMRRTHGSPHLCRSSKGGNRSSKRRTHGLQRSSRSEQSWAGEGVPRRKDARTPHEGRRTAESKDSTRQQTNTLAACASVSSRGRPLWVSWCDEWCHQWSRKRLR